MPGHGARPYARLVQVDLCWKGVGAAAYPRASHPLGRVAPRFGVCHALNRDVKPRQSSCIGSHITAAAGLSPGCESSWYPTIRFARAPESTDGTLVRGREAVRQGRRRTVRSDASGRSTTLRSPPARGVLPVLLPTTCTKCECAL